MPEFVLSPERDRMIKQLVEYLPVLRKKTGLSQDEFGELIGKSRQKVSDIERRTAPMGWDTYIAVCIVLETKGALNEQDTPWYYISKEKWF